MGVTRPLAVILSIAAVAWSIVILSAPIGMHDRRVSGPSAIVYAAASRICHQKKERSFEIAGMQMPVCARCSGLYLSGAAGAILAWTRRVRRSLNSVRPVLIAAAVPTVLTFGLEFLGFLAFSNAARAAAALPLGAAAGWSFVQMLRYDARFDGNQILNR